MNAITHSDIFKQHNMYIHTTTTYTQMQQLFCEFLPLPCALASLSPSLYSWLDGAIKFLTAAAVQRRKRKPHARMRRAEQTGALIRFHFFSRSGIFASRSKPRIWKRLYAVLLSRMGEK